MKLFEKILEKHFEAEIKKYCEQIVKENFDNVFKECCTKTFENTTTLDLAYETLEKIALDFLNEHFEKQYYDLNITLPTELHCFENAIHYFLSEFWYNFDIRGFVNSWIYEDFTEKLDELIRKKIVNSDGDFIKV